MAQELKDTFQPTHELIKESVVVDMDLVYKFVEIVLVTRTEIDECLDGLVGICRNLLPLAGFDGLDRVIDEHGEIGNTVVYVRRFIHTDERFIEDGEKIAEELQSSRLYLFVNILFMRI